MRGRTEVGVRKASLHRVSRKALSGGAIQLVGSVHRWAGPRDGGQASCGTRCPQHFPTRPSGQPRTSRCVRHGAHPGCRGQVSMVTFCLCWDDLGDSAFLCLGFLIWKLG